MLYSHGMLETLLPVIEVLYVHNLAGKMINLILKIDCFVSKFIKATF